MSESLLRYPQTGAQRQQHARQGLEFTRIHIRYAAFQSSVKFGQSSARPVENAMIHISRTTVQPSLRDCGVLDSQPSVETLGYYRWSLRDRWHWAAASLLGQYCENAAASWVRGARSLLARTLGSTASIGDPRVWLSIYAVGPGAPFPTSRQGRLPIAQRFNAG